MVFTHRLLAPLALAAAMLPALAGAQGFTSASDPVPGPGSTPEDPVLPTYWVSASNASTGNPQYVFWNPVSGQWFDPEPVRGFTISLTGGSFQSLQTAPGFDHLQVWVGTVLKDADLNPGEAFSFDPDVTSFSIYGITPGLDANLTGSPAAFPLRLTFSGQPSEMRWDGLSASPVPETGAFGMVLMGVVGIGLLTGLRRRSAQ